MSYELHHGDCLDVLRDMPAESIDAVVTDPPYGLAFMGKRWDYDVPSVEVWREVLRVLKPGGHLLSFAGTRTQHRMAVNIEDAGFEIRDMIAWVYGSGFPKSLDVGKAIDRAAGAEREVVGVGKYAGRGRVNSGTYGDAPVSIDEMETTPATEAAKQWDGWGTALKPAMEPITMARKPLAGTVAENVQRYGTGGINVDGCRVGTGGGCAGAGAGAGSRVYGDGLNGTFAQPVEGLGRWPANLIHDGSDEVVRLFPVTSSGGLNEGHKQGAGSFGKIGGDVILRDYGGDTGSAARFFYTPKASREEREHGCHELEHRTAGETTERQDGTAGLDSPRSGAGRTNGSRNFHPTVKPIDLMCYLCRLVTPPGGVVLDPFLGSGTTGRAALMEGFRFVGIERDAEYMEIARARMAAPLQVALI